MPATGAAGGVVTQDGLPISAWVSGGSGPDVRWSLLSATLVAREESAQGQCHVLFGQLRADDIESGAITNSYPQFHLVRDAARFEPARPLECDFEDLLGLGYGFVYNADVSEGAQYPFFSTFLVPAGIEFDAIEISFGENPSVMLEPLFVDTVTAPELPSAEPIQDLPPVTGAPIELFGADQWSINVAGTTLVEGEGRGGLAGRCVLAFGTMTPSASNDPSSLTLFRPRMSVIANGILHWYESGSCDTTEAKALGYQYRPDFVIGRSAAFFDFAFVPEDREIEAITFDDDTLYSIAPVDAVLPP